MSVGCSGGLQIPSAVAQVLINKLAFEDSLSQSIERARVYYGVDTGLTEIEGINAAGTFIVTLLLCARFVESYMYFDFF